MHSIVKREFVGILRTRRALAIILALTISFALLVVFRWPSEARVDLTGAQTQRVFRILTYGLLVGVILLAPAFPATSIVREKNAGTLALLLNSPLRPAFLYLGKLLGSLLFVWLLLVTSLPASAACYAMGGIDLIDGFAALYAVLIVLSVQYVTLGLLVSTCVQSSDAGVRVTYACVFGLSIVSLGPHFFFQGQDRAAASLADVLQALSPLPVAMQIVGQQDVGGQGLVNRSISLPMFLIMSLASSAVFAGLAIRRLNYRIFDRDRSAGVITDERSFAARLLRRLWFLVDPQRRKSGIPWFANAVMVKEFRTRRFGRVHWLLRLVAVCAVVSLLLTYAATTGTMDWGVETIGGLLVLMQVTLIVLITPSLAAGLISTERESGGWDLLRMTPLSTVSIVTGKLLSTVWTLLLVLLATLPGYLVMVYIQPALWLQIYLVMICLLLTAALALCVSSVISSLFARTAPATTTSYVVLIVLFLGPLLIWAGRDAPFGHRTVQTVLMANPLGAALSAIEAPGFAQYELLPASWSFCGMLSALLLIVMAVRVRQLARPT